MKLKPILFSCLISLSACSDNEEVNQNQGPYKTETSPLVKNTFTGHRKTVSATSELRPPEHIIDATIISKPGFTAWTSHLLLLSKSGKIYATNTGFGEMTDVAKGPFSDILGISRGEMTGVLLALDGNNQIKGFIENAAGGFEQLNLNQLDEDVTGFCDLETPSGTHFYGIVNGAIQKMDFNISDIAMVLSKSGDPIEDGVRSCHLNRQSQWTLVKDNENILSNTSFATNLHGTIQITISGQGLFVDNNTVQYSVDIIPGLSILGIDDPSWVYTSSENLGNTFSQGLTMVGGSKDNRIVLISNDYLSRVLFGENPGN